MLFNSTTFLIFFAGFHLAYYLCRRHLAARNVLIVGASYLFYGWWDFRFLGLLVASSCFDYAVGLRLGNTASARARRAWVTLSLLVNLGVLGFFKYCDFFIESMAAILQALQIPVQPRALGVILPVGISFYTFQSISYVIDVYRGTIPPTRNLLGFLAYVAFFPQLVAGPIERAAHLLPQFFSRRSVTGSMLAEGVWLTLWGLFKKVVLADSLAPLVDLVYAQETPSGPMVLLATLAFAGQIYCDFSGYSDIARGTALTLGFDLMLNFRIPYAATHLREFWHRWHISLSTWLRDYLYIPLGGNRAGTHRTYFNLLLTMALGGLWHGAAWNFLLWGVWHGLGLCLLRAWESTRWGRRPLPPWIGWGLTMAFVGYGWLLFRAGSWTQIVVLTSAAVRWELPLWFGSYVINLLAAWLPLLLLEGWMTYRGDVLSPLRLSRWPRACLQAILLWVTLCSWTKSGSPFIYFQF